MANKTVLIRVIEWTAWLPQDKDASTPLMMSHGVTAFEADDSEKVLEVAVSATGQSRHIPMEVDGANINKRHGLYAFQAVLASQTTSPVPDAVVPEGTEGHAIVLPGSDNRKTRRDNGKGSR